MERTFEAFWRQVFNIKFYYTKWMCDEMHPAQDISAWLILLESSESHLYRIVYWLEKVFLASVKFAVQALDDWETDYPNVISLMFFAHWDGTHRSLSRDVGKRLLRMMVARNPVVTGITRYSFPHLPIQILVGMMYWWQKWNSTILTRKASLAFLKHGKYHSPWNINILFDCCRIACFNFFILTEL